MIMMPQAILVPTATSTTTMQTVATVAATAALLDRPLQFFETAVILSGLQRPAPLRCMRKPTVIAMFILVVCKKMT
jgi:hypothetical protein